MKQLLEYTETTTPVTVTCSCGQTSTVKWSATKFIAANPNWKFRTLSDIGETPQTAGTTKSKNIGWYCGNPNHEQSID